MIFRMKIRGHIVECDSVEALAELFRFHEADSQPGANGATGNSSAARQASKASRDSRKQLQQLAAVLSMVAEAGRDGVPVAEIAETAKMQDARGLGIFATVVARHIPGVRLQDVIDSTRDADGVKRWRGKSGLGELVEKLEAVRSLK